MKKILSAISGICMFTATSAQSDNISLYVYAAEQQGNIPKASVDYLSNNLCTAITTDGLAAQNECMTQFLLVPKVNTTTKNVLAGTQQQVVLTMDVNLQVIDNKSGIVFCAETFNIKGAGTNETKAYNAAFRTINKGNSKIKSLVSTAKEKILYYYETECANIMKKAELAASQEKYEEAFYLLSMIPSQCSQYNTVIDTGIQIWDKYSDHSCGVNLGKARAAWIANQNIYGANIAGGYLSKILPDASCYEEAKQLYRDIKTGMGERWKFEMKQSKSEQELKLAKVKAIQSIGEAYGNGQQPILIIH